MVSTQKEMSEAITVAVGEVRKARKRLARRLFTLEVLLQEAGANLASHDLSPPRAAPDLI